MAEYERVGNIHVHTLFSDGTADHEQLAAIACQAGLDFVVITDHAIYAEGYEDWYGETLLLIGEEIPVAADGHGNHLLILNARESLSAYRHDAQRAIDECHKRGGLSFIAHPFEHNGAFAREPNRDWRDWEATGFTGLEIWNYASEFRSHLTSRSRAALYKLFPHWAIEGPCPEALAKWDELLSTWGPIYAIGSSDAHGTAYHVGPLRREVLGYRNTFHALNTHVLLPEPWSRDAIQDAALVYSALARGRAFVAYDGLTPARGFQFEAECDDQIYSMGDVIRTTRPVHFRIHLPRWARLRLIHNGRCVARALTSNLIYASASTGIFRVEVYQWYWGRLRSWILSNPIMVTRPS